MTKEEYKNLKPGDYLADSGRYPELPFGIVGNKDGVGIRIHNYDTLGECLGVGIIYLCIDSLSHGYRIPTEKELKLFKLMTIK